MKTKILFFAVSLFTITSCVKHDIGEMPDPVSENIKTVFGVDFDPTHDWCSTTSGTVEIKVNAPLENITGVKLLVYTKVGDDNLSLKKVNETSCQGGDVVTLGYDIPSDNEGLYVMYVSGDGEYYIEKLGTITSAKARASRASQTRGGEENSPVITGSSVSYETRRGYPGFESEVLYQYGSQSSDVPNYGEDFIETMRAVIFTYFPNGRKYNNLPQIKNSGYYNENCYPITTGDEPIIVSPIYKNDGGYGEIEACDLYYYYFKESDLGDDPVSTIKSLPKYKAIQLSESIKGDDVLEKHHSYTLVYWGDGQPIVGETTGSYQFPQGYKIGFMLQSNNVRNGDVKRGELYCDGRLNNMINKHGHFASSKLGDGDPRMAWLTVNKKMLLCCESGTDTDFNDLIFEVEGGIEPFDIIPDTENNSYVFCFEDQRLGDYDMNDVVIKGERLDETHVKYTLMACGAYDELYIYNVEGEKINKNNEVHSLFLGSTSMTFINTTSQIPETRFVEDVVVVNKNFSFLSEDLRPYIYDKTKNYFVKVSTVGQDPHAIMIPYNFRWPLEKICIKDAYLEFNKWGQNKVTSTDWYKYPEEDKVMVEY